ncbi:hypothetical protein Syun_025306 [Stephania yunnanensis]|uniref:Uncharacterized protein n=1 Tax=Stephania yunnanensis TaxID=152371 RepID=A0AAP0ERY9_9MAGN
MSSRARSGDPSSVCCLGKESDGEVELTIAEETGRVPFDVNLPVVLAGFAFEAYTSPPVHIALRLRSGHRLLLFLLILLRTFLLEYLDYSSRLLVLAYVQLPLWDFLGLGQIEFMKTEERNRSRKFPFPF